MKKLLVVVLILLNIFALGCSKDDDSNNVVKLNKIDISALSNKQIKNAISSPEMKEGVYQFSTKSNTYIYFLGIDSEFTNISCSLEDKTLTIKATLTEIENKDEEPKLSKKLFVIYEKNNTASGNKTKYFDTINLTVNEKASNFEDIILLN